MNRERTHNSVGKLESSDSVNSGESLVSLVCIVRVFVWYLKNPARIKFVRNLEKKRIKKEFLLNLIL